jgi:hypothetical protein
MSLSQAEKSWGFLLDLRDIKHEFVAAAKQALLLVVIDQVEMSTLAKDASVERSMYMVSAVTALDSTKNCIDMVGRLMTGDEIVGSDGLKDSSKHVKMWSEIENELFSQFPNASGSHVDFYKKATSLVTRWWNLYEYFLKEVLPSLS